MQTHFSAIRTVASASDSWARIWFWSWMNESAAFYKFPNQYRFIGPVSQKRCHSHVNERKENRIKAIFVSDAYLATAFKQIACFYLYSSILFLVEKRDIYAFDGSRISHRCAETMTPVECFDCWDLSFSFSLETLIENSVPSIRFVIEHNEWSIGLHEKL